MKSLIRCKKALSKGTTNLIILALIGVLSLSALGVINLSSYVPDGTTPPPPPPGDGITDIPETSIRTGTAKWGVRDKLSKTKTAIGDTAYLSIISADPTGYFDPLTPLDESELVADPEETSAVLAAGKDYVISVTSDDDPTGGYEKYPRWFYIENLDHGAAIKAFNLLNPINCISQINSGGNYKFTVNKGSLGETVGTVNWVPAATPYWDLGVFELYGRVAKDYLLAQITHNGVVGCSISDGATFIDTDAEITANFTFTGDQEDLMYELRGEVADVAYGIPFLDVGSNGLIRQYNAVLVWGTDATGVDATQLTNDGWKPMIKAGLDEVAFYYVIDPTKGGIPTTGGTINIQVPISINDGGLVASTEYEFEAWVADSQNVDNVAIGTISATSLTGTTGFLADPSIDSVVIPLGITLSSGALATPVLMGHFTTNA